MTVLKAWIAGKMQSDITDCGLFTDKNRETSLSDRLNSTVNQILAESVVLNCSAELRRQEDTGLFCPFPFFIVCLQSSLVEGQDYNPLISTSYKSGIRKFINQIGVYCWATDCTALSLIIVNIIVITIDVVVRCMWTTNDLQLHFF